MNKIRITVVLSLLMTMLIAGCGNSKELTVQEPPKQEAVQGDETKPNQGDQGKEIDKEFELLTAQAKEAREVIAFLDSNLPKVDVTTADKLFVALDSFYERYLPSLNDNFNTMLEQPGTAEKMNEVGYPIDINNIKNDDTLKKWLLDQTEAHFALDNTEGMFFWKVDYVALQKKYDPYLSEDLKSYLALRAAQFGKRFVEDASLTISREELGERILAAEHYLTQYPMGLKRAEVKVMYSEYMNHYITNYRYDAIDDKTMKLVPAVKKSYEQLVKQHPKTKTAELVQEYLNLINENKDVIYSPGQGNTLQGPLKPNISKFWESLDEKIKTLLA